MTVSERLKDFTSDELRSELKRRAKDARKHTSRKAEYEYTKAVVTYVSQAPFTRRRYEVTVNVKDRKPYMTSFSFYAKLLGGAFNKSTAPQIGDLVEIRSRKSKFHPQGLWTSYSTYICRIIERNKGI